MSFDKHLGKTASGEIMPAYVTPDEVDHKLLVAIPRRTAREKNNVDERFVGWDVWNCYEFSTLLNNGRPVVGVLRIKYPSSSINMVESKSLKLYLNSYNLVRWEKVEHAIRYVRYHLEELLGYVEVHFHQYATSTGVEPFVSTQKVTDLDTIHYSYDFNQRFETLLTTRQACSRFFVKTSILRSNCRVTNQPDWADVYVYFNGENLLRFDTFLHYLISMRNENHFHEEVCEMIYQSLDDALEPRELMVACLYTRRGGIDINPIRADSHQTLKIASPLLDITNLQQKTFRQ